MNHSYPYLYHILAECFLLELTGSGEPKDPGQEGVSEILDCIVIMGIVFTVDLPRPTQEGLGKDIMFLCL